MKFEERMGWTQNPPALEPVSAPGTSRNPSRIGTRQQPRNRPNNRGDSAGISRQTKHSSTTAKTPRKDAFATGMSDHRGQRRTLGASRCRCRFFATPERRAGCARQILQPRASQALAPPSNALQTRLGSLTDPDPLLLCDCGENSDDRLAEHAQTVHVLLRIAFELDPEIAQASQVLERGEGSLARQPIQAPEQQTIEAVRLGIFPHGLEAWPVPVLRAQLVRVLRDYVPAL